LLDDGGAELLLSPGGSLEPAFAGSNPRRPASVR
jgi:hypothetical protein